MVMSSGGGWQSDGRIAYPSISALFQDAVYRSTRLRRPSTHRCRVWWIMVADTRAIASCWLQPPSAVSRCEFDCALRNCPLRTNMVPAFRLRHLSLCHDGWRHGGLGGVCVPPVVSIICSDHGDWLGAAGGGGFTWVGFSPPDPGGNQNLHDGRRWGSFRQGRWRLVD